MTDEFSVDSIQPCGPGATFRNARSPRPTFDSSVRTVLKSVRTPLYGNMSENLHVTAIGMSGMST